MSELIVGIATALYFMATAATIVLWTERTAGRDMRQSPDWLTWGMIVVVALALSLISKHL